MTLATALRQGAELLERGAISAPRLTAEVLLMHALHVSLGTRNGRAWLFAHSDEELQEAVWIHYGRYLHERLKGKPTQYITKRQEFYGREFRVSPAVLIPRPETEHSVETVLRRVAEWPEKPRRVMDIGTGSGAIGVTLALELGADASVHLVLTDISFAALEVARGNAHSLGAPAECVCCDLASALTGPFDVIASNPPYIPLAERAELAIEVIEHEPHLALFGGEGGAEIYPGLIDDAARLLRPGGLLVMELSYQGIDDVRPMLSEAEWTAIEVTRDLAGWPRVVSAIRL